MRRLVAALALQYAFFVDSHLTTASYPFQFQVSGGIVCMNEHSSSLPSDTLPEKESGDESQHSKGRLFEVETKCFMRYAAKHGPEFTRHSQGDLCNLPRVEIEPLWKTEILRQRRSSLHT